MDDIGIKPCDYTEIFLAGYLRWTVHTLGIRKTRYLSSIRTQYNSELFSLNSRFKVKTLLIYVIFSVDPAKSSAA